MKRDGFQLEPELRPVVGRHFDIYDANVGYDHLSFFVTLPADEEAAFNELRSEMKEKGFLPVLTAKGGEHTIDIIPAPVHKKSKIIINVLLLIATIGTTIFVGTVHWLGYNGVDIPANPERVASVFLEYMPGGFLFFSLPLMLILGTHELGHYFMSKRHGVDASLPYFIPAPTTFGTFGAFISVKEPIPNKKALLDIGLAGPVAGLVVAIPVTVLGLYLSTLNPGAVENITEYGGIELGIPLLFRFLVLMVPNASEVMHPTAFAGWVGLFITAINLLPAGQLDGGHVARALFGKGARYISFMTVAFLVILGFVFGQYGWFLFAVIIMFLGMKHGPPLNDISGLDGKRVAAGVAAALIFAVCFVPSPLQTVEPTVGYDLVVSQENQTATVAFGEPYAEFPFTLENAGVGTISIVLNASAINWASDFSLEGADGNVTGLPATVSVNGSETVKLVLRADTIRAEPGNRRIELEAVCQNYDKTIMKDLLVHVAGFAVSPADANGNITVTNLLPVTHNITVLAEGGENDTWVMGGVTFRNPVDIAVPPLSNVTMRLIPLPDRDDVQVCFTSRLYDESQRCTYSG